MNVLIDSFLDYLRYERNYSEYTINAYFKDLQQFEDFVKEKKEGIFVPGEVDTDIADLMQYNRELYDLRVPLGTIIRIPPEKEKQS